MSRKYKFAMHSLSASTPEYNYYDAVVNTIILLLLLFGIMCSQSLLLYPNLFMR